ncbi:MAG: endo alpha-1,4 polygalactosaminidase [Thermincola sp.]|jgi:hypothetical protein|nr:endo alpha-1,4 polygalactosaminidase [Thermincola sp.]MDT3704100.1 endo alpha-1,4 polygalactosaminidase [Thermincola sp.]
MNIKSKIALLSLIFLFVVGLNLLMLLVAANKRPALGVFVGLGPDELEKLVSYQSGAANKRPAFGVFVGLGPDELEKLVSYQEVIVDAGYFSQKDIDFLHQNNVKVYSYLNIGSIESFRPYYNEFQDITLGDYENWPDEKWLDVSSNRWSHYVINVLAKDLTDKGVDGFFIDNTDVYSIYPEDKIYDGILTILKGLKQNYDKKIILNSGFDFLDKALSENVDIFAIVQGVTRESVLTTVDFANKTLSVRPREEVNWALNRLKQMKALGPEIYVVEYSNTPIVDFFIRLTYLFSGYKVYIANSIELN